MYQSKDHHPSKWRRPDISMFCVLLVKGKCLDPTYRNCYDKPDSHTSRNGYGSLSIVGGREEVWVLEGAVGCGRKSTVCSAYTGSREWRTTHQRELHASENGILVEVGHVRVPSPLARLFVVFRRKLTAGDGANTCWTDQ